MKYHIIGEIIAILIVIALGYLISISDLPDWFKFFLLRR